MSATLADTPKRGFKIAASAITAIWNLALIILISRKLYCSGNSKNAQQIVASVKYASFAMFYALVITHISHISLFGFGQNKDNIFFFILLAIFYIGYCVAVFAYYIFMVFRLFYVFKHSIYAMSTKAIYFHAAILIIIALIFIISIIVYEILKTWYMFYLCLSLCTACYAIGFTHLIYSFNTNLFALILRKKRSAIHFPSPSLPSSTQSSIANIPPNIESQMSITATFTERQMLLLDTIIKHTVLGMIAVGNILFFVIITVICTVINSDHVYIDDNIIEVIYWLSQMVMTCGVTMCVFMGFRMNQMYYQNWCNCCDRRCSYFCEYMANFQVDASSVEREMGDAITNTDNRGDRVNSMESEAAAPTTAVQEVDTTKMQVELVLSEEKKEENN